jgi:hypothetical protein
VNQIRFHLDVVLAKHRPGALEGMEGYRLFLPKTSVTSALFAAFSGVWREKFFAFNKSCGEKQNSDE